MFFFFKKLFQAVLDFMNDLRKGQLEIAYCGAPCVFSQLWQVKDVLFEPVRKTQDAMFFVKTSNNMWMPCGPKQPGAVQISMQELAAQGLASQVLADSLDMNNCCCHLFPCSVLSLWWSLYHLDAHKSLMLNASLG
jgi:hypothetical protein